MRHVILITFTVLAQPPPSSRHVAAWCIATGGRGWLPNATGVSVRGLVPRAAVE